MSSHLRFEDAEEAVEESSNLDQSMCDIAESDDKTSADYYFDSYSHFGIFPIPNTQKVFTFSSGYLSLSTLITRAFTIAVLFVSFSFFFCLCLWLQEFMK